MNEYILKSAKNVNIDTLIETLTNARVPHKHESEGKAISVSIGPDQDIIVKALIGNKSVSKASVITRFEHPVLKGIVVDWMNKCGVTTHENFYKWHFQLSPSVVNGVKAKWKLDLSGFQATPVIFSQFVLVFMFSGDVAQQLAMQLEELPHRNIRVAEFIRCQEFSVSGEDPLDTVVYGWRSDQRSQLFVVTGSAPAVTMLSLWVIPEQSTVETNIEDLPRQNL